MDPINKEIGDESERQNSDCMQPHAYTITNQIDSSTTIEDFKNMINYPTFELDYGGRCGWNVFGTTAQKGSLELLKHLIGLRPDLVNLGNEFGWTPLFCVCSRSEETEDIILEKCKFLLEQGANPNFGVMHSSGDSVHGSTHAGTKPIDAARKKNMSKVVTFLESYHKF